MHCFYFEFLVGAYVKVYSHLHFCTVQLMWQLAGRSYAAAENQMKPTLYQLDIKEIKLQLPFKFPFWLSSVLAFFRSGRLPF